jgi:pimeloyl-ACP methyl ester carboxylesterase
MLPEAVVGLMDHLRIDRAALVGNSMGGAVAVIVAADHPERVSSLVLIDAAGFNLEPRDRPAMMRLATSPAARLLEPLPGKRLLVERALHEVFHDPGLVTDERLSEYLSGTLRKGSLAARASLLRSLEGRPAAVRERLPGITAPTLVIWGREDTWIPLAHADLFVEAIPHARGVVIDDCGHMPQEEKPTELLPLVGEFLAEVAGATSARG